MNLIFVDVEATTKSPMTGVMTQFGAVHYHSRQAFFGLLRDSEPDPDNPARPRITGGSYPELPVMRAFKSWCEGFEGRPVFVSDNNGWDAMWITCKFDELGIENPFGHSSRRISDFYAGLVANFGKTQDWKKWRRTPHDHNPVNDAMGNVEAFATMMYRHGDYAYDGTERG